MPDQVFWNLIIERGKWRMGASKHVTRDLNYGVSMSMTPRDEEVHRERKW